MQVLAEFSTWMKVTLVISYMQAHWSTVRLFTIVRLLDLIKSLLDKSYMNESSVRYTLIVY